MASSRNGKEGGGNAPFPLSGAKLLIGIPTRGQCSIDFAKSLAMSTAFLTEMKIVVSILEVKSSCFIEVSRNRLLAECVNGDYTHLLMIDDDMGWEIDLPYKMMLENKGITAAIGPKKHENEDYACELLTNPDGTPMQDDGLLLASHVGAAFMLLKRKAIEMLFEKATDLRCCAIDKKNGYMIFKTTWLQNMFMTEDYTFCEFARANGHKVWVYPDAEFSHEGAKIFRGNLQKYLLKQPETKKEKSEGVNLSVVIVAFNAAEDLDNALNSLCDHRPVEETEVIIIDNSPQKLELKAMERLEAHFRVRHLHDCINHGFAEGCNIGARLSVGKHILFMNPDTMVFRGWYETLESHLDGETGAVGPISNYVAGLQRVDWYKKLEPEEKCEELADYFLNRGIHKPIDTKLLIGFFLLVPRKVWDLVGEFDKEFFFGCDDLDYSLRIQKAGLKLKIASDVFVYHKGHVTANSSMETPAFEEKSADHLRKKLALEYPGKTSSDLWGCGIFRTEADV